MRREFPRKIKAVLRNLFDRCQHVWVEFATSDIVRVRNDDIVGKASFCKCEKCGARRVFKMKL